MGMDDLVLILAPRGRDAELAVRILARKGVSCHVCVDIADLLREAVAGAGAALVTEKFWRRTTSVCCCAGWERSRPGLIYPSSC